MFATTSVKSSILSCSTTFDVQCLPKREAKCEKIVDKKSLETHVRVNRNALLPENVFKKLIENSNPFPPVKCMVYSTINTIKCESIPTIVCSQRRHSNKVKRSPTIESITLTQFLTIFGLSNVLLSNIIGLF